MPGDAVVVVDYRTLAEPRSVNVSGQVLTGYNEAYREGLGKDEILYAYLDDRGTVASYAFVLFETMAKRVLRLPRTAPLIANCFTRVESGAAAGSTRGCCASPRWTWLAGPQEGLLNCTSDNSASIRGIEAAGFARMAEIRSGLFLSRVVFGQRILPVQECDHHGDAARSQR